LTLVVGDETVLVERAVAEAIAAVRAGHPEVEVVEVDNGVLADTDLSVLFSPSLFGERRVVVVRDVQDFGADAADGVAAQLRDLPDEITAVATHAGGAKGKALLKSLRELAGRTVECPKITKYRDRLDFIRAEVSRAGGAIDGPAVDAVLEAVGSDLAELATACAQLVADSGGRIDVDVVTRYHRGPAEVSGFAVADAAVDGQPGQALAQLRWALSTGVSPVLVTSALASGVRQIAQVASAGRTARPAEIAKDLGMPPWKVERVQRQSRGWRPDGIATALAAVAEADAAVKGAGVDPAYALERAVLAIAAARGTG
jgi:DNA polymerase-3 subunit delta